MALEGHIDFYGYHADVAGWLFSGSRIPSFLTPTSIMSISKKQMPTRSLLPPAPSLGKLKSDQPRRANDNAAVSRYGDSLTYWNHVIKNEGMLEAGGACSSGAGTAGSCSSALL
jgi:hypothetical protein